MALDLSKFTQWLKKKDKTPEKKFAMELTEEKAVLNRKEKQYFRKKKGANFENVLRAHWRKKNYQEMKMKAAKKAAKRASRKHHQEMVSKVVEKVKETL